MLLDVLKNLNNEENGQGMVEYGLILGILSTGAILFIIVLQYNIENLAYEVVTKIASAINNIVFN